MRDHEIIAILEGCDDAQRARVMAWARKRWPAPKKAAMAAPAQPLDTIGSGPGPHVAAVISRAAEPKPARLKIDPDVAVQWAIRNGDPS
jgi:hypothetical protein